MTRVSSRLQVLDFQQAVVYFGFLAIFLFFAVTLYDDGFLTQRNLTNIVLQTAPATIMAVGLVFALSAGEIDLSFGSIVAVSALSCAVALQSFPMPVGVLVGLGVGVAIGAFNGVLVAYLKLPSFLVTLATMGLFAGIARSMTNLRSVPVMNDTFTGLFGSGKLFSVPSLVIWTCLGVGIGHLIYRHTRFGAHVLATGDNPRAAQVSGIKVARVRLYVMMICGGCAGLAGLLYAGRLQAAKYTLGESDLMTVIAAVIVGGTALNGGKGSVVGALLGSLLMGMLNNGLILMNLKVSDQMIVRGLIIAREAAKAAAEAGRVQNILARIQTGGDTFYRGHEGGFAAEDIVKIADEIDALDGARFAGITTFPALLFDLDSNSVKPTQNLATLSKALKELADAGRTDIEVNAPGTNSMALLPALAEAGATQVEPGNALHGTTPLHAVQDLPEGPAVLYLSEVSHQHKDEAYCFGGGLYIDPVFPDYDVHALVLGSPTAALEALYQVDIPEYKVIDYYGMINTKDRPVPNTGDTVVFGFRGQSFVTRANAVGVSGVASGTPKVTSIENIFGQPVDRHEGYSA